MSRKNPEFPDTYSIEIFDHPRVLERDARRFEGHALSEMIKRANRSSVPPFIAPLIQRMGQELRPLVQQGRLEQEVALRILGFDYPSRWSAHYALVYSTAIATTKLYLDASAQALSSFDPEALQAKSSAESMVRGVGAHTLFMEHFSWGPGEPMDWVWHLGTKIKHKYPFPWSQKSIRDYVNKYFSDKNNRFKAESQARALKIPPEYLS